METNLAHLIENAIGANTDVKLKRIHAEFSKYSLETLQESEQLANNALEEALNELIEAKVNQMLQRV